MFRKKKKKLNTSLVLKYARMDQKDVRVSVPMSQELKEAVKTESARLDISQSDFIKIALDQYFKR